MRKEELNIDQLRGHYPPDIIQNLRKIKAFVEARDSEVADVQSPVDEEDVFGLIHRTIAALEKYKRLQQGHLTDKIEQTVEYQELTQVLEALNSLSQNADLGSLILDATLMRGNLMRFEVILGEHPEMVPALKILLENMPLIRNIETLHDELKKLKRKRPDLIERLRSDIENFDQSFAAMMLRLKEMSSQSVPPQNQEETRDLKISDEKKREIEARLQRWLKRGLGGNE